MGLLNFDYEDNPLKLGLLMAGIQMATQGRQAAGQGFAQGFQAGLLGKRSRESNELEQFKLQRELERQKRLEGLDINSSDAVNQLMRAGQSSLAQSLLERGNLQSTREALDASGNPIWMGVTRGGQVNVLGMPLPKVGEGQVITGGRSSLIPGYAGNKAFVAGEEEAAKQGQKYVDVPTEIGDVPMRPDERRNVMGIPGKPDYADIVAGALKNGLFQVESGGNPNAVSPAGAVGLGQILPSTAKNPGFGVEPLGDVNRATPKQNAEFSERYLAQLIRENGGDIQKALSAYNMGQGNVNKGASAPEYVNKVLKNAGAPPPRILSGAELSARKAEAEATAKADVDLRTEKAKEQQRIKQGYENMAPVYDEIAGLISGGNPEYDAEGFLVAPKKPSVLGTSIPDRTAMAAHEFGYQSPEISNTVRVRELGNQLVLARGSLGTGVSVDDAERYDSAAGNFAKPKSVQDMVTSINSMYRLWNKYRGGKGENGTDTAKIPPGARTQTNPRTGQRRYSTDGGMTWTVVK